MFVFRIVFPDYLVQEIAKSIKAFCMSTNDEETNVDFKEFFKRNYADASSVYITTG
jgi:hypothetical protein